MQHILSPAGIAVLERLAHENALVAFDYDGTLAPIVADPTKALMRARTRRALQQVSLLYPCAVISGRNHRSLSDLLRGVRLAVVLGNHGLEPSRAPAAFARRVQRWRRFLEAKLGAQPGVAIEDKAYSLAVHYRASRRKREALARICATVAKLDGARVILGKLVVDVLPAGAPHKGSALVRTRSRLGCEAALFVGDDTTDEDVFALAEPGNLLGIRVGSSRVSHARYFLRDQKEIDVLLHLLIALRRPHHLDLDGRSR